MRCAATKDSWQQPSLCEPYAPTSPPTSAINQPSTHQSEATSPTHHASFAMVYSPHSNKKGPPHPHHTDHPPT